MAGLWWILAERDEIGVFVHQTPVLQKLQAGLNPAAQHWKRESHMG